MKKIRKALLGMAVGIGLSVGLMSGEAKACSLVFDVYRTGLFTAQNGSRITTLVLEYQIVNSKKEELKIWEKRKQFKEEEMPKGAYYDYMINATATGSETYNPDQGDPSAQEDYARQNLFYDSDVSNLTEAEKQKVINTRLSYLESLAAEVLSLSAGARESIAAEVNTLKEAKTTAGGEIQQVDLLVQTKKLMVEQKAADILLQAKLLEFEAAQLITGLNPQRSEDPEKSE